MLKFLFALTLAGLSVTVGLKCLPAWLERASIEKTIERMASSGERDPNALRDIFTKSSNMTGIHSINYNDLRIQQKNGRILIGYNYEVRIPLAANASLVFQFSNEK